VALTAPSGTGKTTIARRVLQVFPQMRFSVSATTRPPRDYETDGVHYHFLTPEAFDQRVAAGELIEFEEVYPGKIYGTLRSEVERATNEAPVLLDIEVKGAHNVKRFFGDDALVIFVRPPSMEALAERLHRRATEDPHSLQDRLSRAEMELQQADRFDAIVVNDDLEDAVAETIQLVADFLDAEPVEA
jgi:guanylate kinase